MARLLPLADGDPLAEPAAAGLILRRAVGPIDELGPPPARERGAPDLAHVVEELRSERA